MSSESEPSMSALIESLMTMPLFASFTATTRPDSHPIHDSTDPEPDRIILINPLMHEMLVIDWLMNDLSIKDGHPPASEASIDGLPSVEIKCADEIEKLGGECVICLEELQVGDVVNEMPCKHKFHGGCVKKWLKAHGSCPVCRYKMPVDDLGKKIGDGGVRGRRGIWVGFTFGDGRSITESENSNEESEGRLNDL